MSVAQQAQALERANAIRLRLAEVKRQVAAGETPWLDVLHTTDTIDERVQVFHLLRAIPRVGPGTARHVMTVAGIAPAKRVSDLTDRQRTAIRETMRRRRPGLFDEHRGRADGPTIAERARTAERERDELRALATQLGQENARLRAELEAASS